MVPVEATVSVQCARVGGKGSGGGSRVRRGRRRQQRRQQGRQQQVSTGGNSGWRAHKLTRYFLCFLFNPRSYVVRPSASCARLSQFRTNLARPHRKGLVPHQRNCRVRPPGLSESARSRLRPGYLTGTTFEMYFPFFHSISSDLVAIVVSKHQKKKKKKPLSKFEKKTLKKNRRKSFA